MTHGALCTPQWWLPLPHTGTCPLEHTGQMLLVPSGERKRALPVSFSWSPTTVCPVIHTIPSGLSPTHHHKALPWIQETGQVGVCAVCGGGELRKDRQKTCQPKASP